MYSSVEGFELKVGGDSRYYWQISISFLKYFSAITSLPVNRIVMTPYDNKNKTSLLSLYIYSRWKADKWQRQPQRSQHRLYKWSEVKLPIMMLYWRTKAVIYLHTHTHTRSMSVKVYEGIKGVLVLALIEVDCGLGISSFLSDSKTKQSSREEERHYIYIYYYK